VAVFFGVFGMYATGTLWRDDDFSAGAGEDDWASEGEAGEDDASADEEAPRRGHDDNDADGADRARREAARAWARGAHGSGSEGDADSDADERGTRALLPSAAPTTPAPARASSGGGDIAMTPLTGLRAVAAAPPPPGPPHAYGAAALWLPRAAFFQRPPFGRLMFTKFLLSHLAAVAAWTGLWDILDQTVLPALSESCILRAGFLAEYPCVLVKFALVALGTAGLHWTGTLYTIDEDMGARPGLVMGGGHAGGAAGMPLPWQQQLARPAGGGGGERRRRRAQPAPLLAAAAVIARLKRKRALRVAARAAASRARRGALE
jgi:hypothetical protein